MMAKGSDTHQPPYLEIDVSRWELSGEKELGTKPKRWRIEPNTRERWLMKDATFNTAKGGPKYRKGDDWAERISYGVAGALSLPAAKVELAVDRGGEEHVYGTICRTVLKEGEVLVLGNTMLAEQGTSVSDGDRREPYTPTAIYRALGDCGPPAGPVNDQSAWDVFVGYLVLDALIGNTDRHEKNRAVVVSGSGRRCLAPTFDHASSLGFLLSDPQKEERLKSKDRNYTPEAFADRAKTRFVTKQHPIDAVAEARMLDGGDAAAYWLNQPKHVDDLVAPIWAILKHRMSTTARVFAERVMHHTGARLTDHEPR